MGCTCKPLPRTFFLPSPVLVAPALLGKLLIRRWRGRIWRARLVETEAYLGRGDAAAHSAAGPTARNRVLFGEPGHAYLYLIYGMHLCLNVSTLPAGEAGCVLLRAAADAGGGPISGPGRLTRALHIPHSLNGGDLTSAGALFLADDGFRPEEILVSARIGISKAAQLPYRFFLPGQPAVTQPRRPVLQRLQGAAALSPIATAPAQRLYSGIS
ncbi:MAG: DNA-3-methyladenine glycosylase [Terriglobales bacterium]